MSILHAVLIAMGVIYATGYVVCVVICTLVTILAGDMYSGRSVRFGESMAVLALVSVLCLAWPVTLYFKVFPGRLRPDEEDAVDINVRITVDLGNQTKEWIMANIDDVKAKLATLTQAVNDAVTRGAADMANLQTTIADLQAQLAAGGMSDADAAALQAEMEADIAVVTAFDQAQKAFQAAKKLHFKKTP